MKVPYKYSEIDVACLNAYENIHQNSIYLLTIVTYVW